MLIVGVETGVWDGNTIPINRLKLTKNVSLRTNHCPSQIEAKNHQESYFFNEFQTVQIQWKCFYLMEMTIFW